MRGQTTLDFAVGVVVFVVTVAFVVSFVPGMFEPFTGGDQDNTVAGNRVATQLSTSALAVPSKPYVLDRICVTDFFSGTNPPALHCGFDGSTVQERVGLADSQSIQVRLVGDDVLDSDSDDGTLCENNNFEIVEQANTASCTTVYEVGKTPPSGTSQSVTLARRTVSIGGDADKLDGNARLEVKLWG